MRIYFNAMTLPKKAAKRFQKVFQSQGKAVALNEAQRITALMLGYQDWHSLEQTTKSSQEPASLSDEECCLNEQFDRLKYQAVMLGKEFSLQDSDLFHLTLRLRVSSRSPKSPEFISKLPVMDQSPNRLVYSDNCGFSLRPGWVFHPSSQSAQTRETLYDLEFMWMESKLGFTEYLKKLNDILDDQPDNLAAYLCLLSAAQHSACWHIGTPYLSKLESVILNALPSDYPLKRKAHPVHWAELENRDYLRSLYHLAEGYYASGNFKKAKQWFLFLSRCTDSEMGEEQLFLYDLRQKPPAGNIHQLSEIAIEDRYRCRDTGKWLFHMRKKT